jgi:hypothetical protein
MSDAPTTPTALPESPSAALEEASAAATEAVIVAIELGGREVMGMRSDQLPEPAATKLKDAVRRASAAARSLAGMTTLDRRKWALEQAAFERMNPMNDIGTQLAGLRLFSEIQREEWTKALDLFPPLPPGTTVNNFGATPDAIEAARAAAARAKQERGE